MQERLLNNTTNKSYDFIAIPEFMQELIAAGGLINFAKKEAAEKENN